VSNDVNDRESALWRWRPARLGRRSVRRFRRRTRATQLRTVITVGAIVAGALVYIAASPSTGGSAAASTGGGGGSKGLAAASTSTRGISGNTINVVFPVVSLNSVAGKLGFAQTAEYGEQKKAINFFVGQVNKQGGIHGKKIHAIIATFTPENTSEMRALCKDWTEGSPAAFAVVDGVGTWTETNQLCITQEGQTPLISQWSTVSTWTSKGSPYLWWIGPAQTAILQATVNWGLATGLIGGTHKVGVVAGDRASDQVALKKYLLPDLRRAGVQPVVETIPAEPTESSNTSSDAPLVVQKLKAAGVTSMIPLIPFNVFYPLLGAEKAQSYYPKLLLSDYEESIESALGLIPTTYETALNGQEGITTETLGGVDDTRPESKGGYDPGLRDCYTPWHKAYPQVVGKGYVYTLKEPNATGQDVNHHIVTTPGPYIEEQGPVQSWCTAIRLFATAARNAGPDLNRRTFVQGMAKIKNFQGGSAPVLSYGPKKFYGPTQYRIVQIHNNTPTSPSCDSLPTGNPQGTCWVVKQNWQPLPTG
jgi:Periplasmic binding protein